MSSNPYQSPKLVCRGPRFPLWVRIVFKSIAAVQLLVAVLLFLLSKCDLDVDVTHPWRVFIETDLGFLFAAATAFLAGTIWQYSNSGDWREEP